MAINLKKSPILHLFVSTCLISACSKKSETTTSSTTTTEIDGSWNSSCSGSGPYSKTTMVFSGGSTTGSIYYYVNSTTCAGSADATMSFTNTYSLGAAVSSPANSKKIDATFTAVSITPNTADGLTLINGSFGCTGATFTTGTATSVLGVNCTGMSVTFPVANAVEYTVYSLTTTATPNTLTFGTTPSGKFFGATSDSARPTTLDTSYLFSKQ